jgi:hypothetical protein
MVATKTRSGRAAKHTGAGPTDAFDTVRKRTAELTATAKSSADAIRAQAVGKAGHATDLVKEEAIHFLDEQKSRAAGPVEEIAAAIHQAARSLQAAKVAPVADYLQDAADAVDGFTRYIKDTDVAQMIDDAAQLARHRPAILLGGMFVAGLLLGRAAQAAQASGTDQRQRRQPARRNTGEDPAPARNGTHASRRKSHRTRHGRGRTT